MAKRRMGVILLLLCFCLCLAPGRALAASTEDALEPIAPERPCRLTLSYACEGTAFSGLSVQLYRIAAVSADFQYTLTDAFQASGLILNGVRTTGEWNVIRTTLEAYILANAVAPDHQASTDDAGQVCFSSLTPGLYLALPEIGEQGDLRCAFTPALVALPGLGEDGLWQYAVTAAAKYQLLPPPDPEDPETLQLKVLKLWKGDEGQGKRPESVEVEIFRNGIFQEAVTLSKANNWAYTWTAPDDGSDWMIVERNIPQGYTMSLEKRETTFLVTNTWIPEAPEDPPVEPPQTGDTANVLLYTILMYASGTIFLLLGIAGRRKRL